jgi:hypothetical protein
MPAKDLAPVIELFLHALRVAKFISPKKLADLIAWKHFGFHIHDGGEKPVAAHDRAGRKRLAKYFCANSSTSARNLWW